MSRNGADQSFPNIPDDRKARELVDEDRVACVFPDCGPFSHVRNNKSHGHDSFVHRDGHNCAGDTAPETFDHVASKAALLDWIRRKMGDQIAMFDSDETNLVAELDGQQVQVRPDAYVRFRNGRAIAVEFQHSPGDFKRIREKNKVYASLGVTPWWIFTVYSPHTMVGLRERDFPLSLGTKTVDLNTAQQYLAKDRIPFFWFDRRHGLLVTPLIRRRVWFDAKEDELWPDGKMRQKTANSYTRLPHDDEHFGIILHIQHLDSCQINPNTADLVSKGVTLRNQARHKCVEEINASRSHARIRYHNWQKAEQERLEQEKAAVQDLAASETIDSTRSIDDTELTQNGEEAVGKERPEDAVLPPVGQKQDTRQVPGPPRLEPQPMKTTFAQKCVRWLRTLFQ